jgi:hypothetical protein
MEVYRLALVRDLCALPPAAPSHPDAVRLGHVLLRNVRLVCWCIMRACLLFSERGAASRALTCLAGRSGKSPPCRTDPLCSVRSPTLFATPHSIEWLTRTDDGTACIMVLTPGLPPAAGLLVEVFGLLNVAPPRHIAANMCVVCEKEREGGGWGGAGLMRQERE